MPRCAGKVMRPMPSNDEKYLKQLSITSELVNNTRVKHEAEGKKKVKNEGSAVGDKT